MQSRMTCSHGPGRFKEVAGNLRVKEVIAGDGERRQRYVVCHNPDEERRQRTHREHLLSQLEAELEVMCQQPDTHSKRQCELLASKRYARFLGAVLATAQERPRAPPGLPSSAMAEGPPWSPPPPPWAATERSQ
jgi:hypothetical protein